MHTVSFIVNFFFINKKKKTLNFFGVGVRTGKEKKKLSNQLIKYSLHYANVRKKRYTISLM
jgi:hypothetical protein